MRKMKDSEISWVGEIPKEWSVKKIKHISYVIGGNGFNVELQGLESGDYPFCKASDISNAGKYLDKAANYVTFDIVRDQHYNIIPKGAILFPKIGEAMKKNNRTICVLDCCADNNCQAIVPFERNSGMFLYYILTCVNMGWFDNAGTIPCMNNRKFLNSKVPFPPLDEQQRIAEFLDKECGKIDGLKADIQAQIDTLEQYKRSVITEAVTHGLNPSAPMKDSGIPWVGQFPTHWTKKKGKYILRYMSKPVKQDDGVITCFRDGEVTLRSNRREDGFTMADKEIGYQGVDVGDLVVHGMDGFAGAIGISDSRGKASPVLNVLNTKQNKKYIMYYLRSMAYGEVFTALSTGIRVRSCDLRWNKLAELLYPLPPIDEQNNIVNYIDEQIARTNEIIADKKSQIETLDGYKKSLIYEYVTGKKEVG